ncbi:TPA: hypothetical protein ACIYQ6_004589, partial [Escherichia coli]
PVNPTLLSHSSLISGFTMKLIITFFVTLCLFGCQASHKQPPVSGKSEPVNSAEVMRNGV